MENGGVFCSSRPKNIARSGRPTLPHTHRRRAAGSMQARNVCTAVQQLPTYCGCTHEPATVPLALVKQKVVIGVYRNRHRREDLFGHHHHDVTILINRDTVKERNIYIRAGSSIKPQISSATNVACGSNSNVASNSNSNVTYLVSC